MIAVIIFIPHGAPFANKTNSFSAGSLLAFDDGGQAGLVADDLDNMIIDADIRSDSLKVGFTGLDVGSLDLLPDPI